MIDEPRHEPTPTPRKKPWVRWVALGCGALLLLGAALFAAIFFVVMRSTAGPEEAVQGFLAAAGSGDYATAHGYFSAPLQQTQPYDQFAAAAAANSMFFQVTETTFNQRSVDTAGANLSGTVTLEVGTEVPASFRLVKENGAWKLLSYQIGS